MMVRDFAINYFKMYLRELSHHVVHSKPGLSAGARPREGVHHFPFQRLPVTGLEVDPEGYKERRAMNCCGEVAGGGAIRGFSYQKRFLMSQSSASSKYGIFWLSVLELSVRRLS